MELQAQHQGCDLLFSILFQGQLYDFHHFPSSLQPAQSPSSAAQISSTRRYTSALPLLSSSNTLQAVRRIVHHLVPTRKLMPESSMAAKDPFGASFRYTGSLRAMYPTEELPKRILPATIARPDYADNGAYPSPTSLIPSLPYALSICLLCGSSKRLDPSPVGSLIFSSDP